MIKGDFYTKHPWYFEYDDLNFVVNVQTLKTAHQITCDGTKNNIISSDIYNSIFRFFNEIVWFHHTAVYGLNGGHGLCHVSLNYKVHDEGYLTRFEQQKIHDITQHLALGFFREAKSNESPYYRFLCYAKILEIPWVGSSYEKTTQKAEWIDSQILNLNCELAKTYRDRKISMLGNETLSHWLHHSGRHGVSHGQLSDPARAVIDPNNHNHWDEIKWANTLMENLATSLMTDQMKIPSRIT